MSYIGMHLLVALTAKISFRKNKRVKILFLEYVKSNAFELSVAIVWALSAIIESQGGRAHMGNSSQFLLKESIVCFVESVIGMNHLFQLTTAAVILLAFLVLIRVKCKGKSGDDEKIYFNWLYRNVICIVLAVVYLILLCARVSPAYIQISCVMISWMFYLLLLEMGSLAYLIKKLPLIIWALPLALYILVFETVIDGRTYADNYAIDCCAATVKALDENIILQITEAEKADLSEVTVLVPYADDKGWPIALSYGGSRISTTLLRHGITHRQITIHLIMDPSINDAFHLP